MSDFKPTVLSADGTLSILDNIKLQDRDDNYLQWLSRTDFPPKSYLKHPLNSENQLNDYKKFFIKNFKISLGAFIRIKRVLFILQNTQYHQNYCLNYCFIDTPIGSMLCITSHKGVCLLEFLDRKMLETEINELIDHHQSNLIYSENVFSKTTKEQLSRYFNKQLTHFDVELDLIGTEFQKKVWQSLLEIDYAKTVSYSQQALNLAMPDATRAVANANGKNKISIIVPCHRVLRKTGELGGYGGGITRKRYLLGLEGG